MKYIHRPFCRKMILEVFPLQYLRISRTVLVTYGDDTDPQMINCIIHKHNSDHTCTVIGQCWSSSSITFSVIRSIAMRSELKAVALSSGSSTSASSALNISVRSFWPVMT